MVAFRPGPDGQLVMRNVEEVNGPNQEHAIILLRSMAAMTVSEIE